MNSFLETFYNSAFLIFSADEDLLEIIMLSLKISLTSLVISVSVGLPIGSFLAVKSFFGRDFFIMIINSLMGLPPVLVGLILYILFSNSGPFGLLQILYTPQIMILAQVLLILPIIISLSRETLSGVLNEYEELFFSLNASNEQIIKTILWDSRYQLTTCILAGLGRAMSEVGAIIIVGGNILHLTRVMTTTIALETSKGNLEFALALGIILMIISLFINILVFAIKNYSKKFSYD
tara:strand:- start:382 stop:1089 length:708 start_codon:yes stop_codon:yes gene_type:complete